jgi:polyisoprenoid-binding protein YceI
MRWTLDSAHTHIAFSIQHMSVTLATGHFTRFAGQFNLDERAPERSSFEVAIDAASITTDNRERDAHLRSPDFLDIEAWPIIRYRSHSITPLGFDHFNVEGELTIRGVTHPVPLDVTLGGVVLDPEGFRRAGVSARSRINREDYGLLWNAPLEDGGSVLGSIVRLEIEAELIELPNADSATEQPGASAQEQPGASAQS